MTADRKSFAVHRSIAGICFICAALAAGVPRAQAQAAANVLTYKDIPRRNGQPYKHWSLFLICNPGWILQNGDAGIKQLYAAFDAFSMAIGPDNLAVWFSHRPNWIPTVDNTDIERMSTYCERFNLLPSQTPQVVTVSRYPDDPDIGGKVVANLSGNAADSSRALTELTDELIRTGLNQTTLDESQWGSRVAASFFAAVSHATCYLNKVSLSINTGVFKAEIAHTADKGC